MNTNLLNIAFSASYNDYKYFYVVKDGVITQITEIHASIAEKWDTKYVNSLPDAAFAIVYTKGKTKIRKLPHHNKNVKSPTENSSVDIPHLRNALARVNQIKDTPASIVSKAKTHLENHAKALLKTHKK